MFRGGEPMGRHRLVGQRQEVVDRVQVADRRVESTGSTG
jgi:hypothetical protein